MVAAGRRHLPRGWSDLGLQLGIWFGFAVLYQLARGIADRNPAKAFSNGQKVFDLEIRFTHRLYELTSRTSSTSGTCFDGRLVDVLELGVHRRRPRGALRLHPPA